MLSTGTVLTPSTDLHRTVARDSPIRAALSAAGALPFSSGDTKTVQAMTVATPRAASRIFKTRQIDPTLTARRGKAHLAGAPENPVGLAPRASGSAVNSGGTVHSGYAREPIRPVPGNDDAITNQYVEGLQQPHPV
jgi:hypothetical protein